MSIIATVLARELCDSRAGAALEVEVRTESHASGRALIPSDQSGAGARRTEVMLGPALLGMDALDQPAIDAVLREADAGAEGQPDASAVLALSIAVARAAADVTELPLWRYLGGAAARTLPVPWVTLRRGALGERELHVAAVPHAPATFALALRTALAVCAAARPADDDDDDAHALEHATAAITAAADSAAVGGEMRLALAPRSSAGDDKAITELCQRFAVAWLVDPHPADALAQWRALGRALDIDVGLASASGAARGASAQVLSATHTGTVSDLLAASGAARDAGRRPVLDAGTACDDPFVADLAVAVGAMAVVAEPTMRGGAPVWNELLRIAWSLGEGAIYAGRR
jgi:enolase